MMITGGYGNIGIAVIDECLRRKHNVSVFDIKNKRTIKLAQKYSKKSVKTIWGDVRKPDCLYGKLENIDALIHLAAILPPLSDINPELCKEVNVKGIKNILDEIERCGNKAAIVEVSSASVMGPTQNQNPPVKPDDALSPTDTYSTSKIEAENLVESSSANYCILRLAAVLPTNINIAYFLNMVKIMFDMPLEARCEIVLDIDVAYALVSAAENISNKGALCKKKGFIAGGSKNGCLLTNGTMLKEVFNQIGLRFPNDSLFSKNINGYYLDWYYTDEIQHILGYQNSSFKKWKDIIRKKLGFYRIPIKLFGKNILKWLEKQSNYYS